MPSLLGVCSLPRLLHWFRKLVKSSEYRSCVGQVQCQPHVVLGFNNLALLLEMTFSEPDLR
jgi:hypothetical protein